MRAFRIEVGEPEDGDRLDVLVARRTGLSRSRAADLLAAGAVTVDGRTASKSYRVATGEVVRGVPLEEETPTPPPVPPVHHEDEDLLVVEKPPGLVVHRAPGLREGTLADALVGSGRPLAPRPGADRPGIVHRLDRDVSGLLLVAKTDEAHEALSGALKRREIVREYLAGVCGAPEVDRGKIDAPIGRNPRHRTRMAVLPAGRRAVTWFRVRERFGEEAALLEVRLETGRTHQIRTHLESIRHPVLGDRAYGHDPSLARELGLGRPFLHAFRLRFVHPSTGEEIEVSSELPEDLARALEGLRAR